MLAEFVLRKMKQDVNYRHEIDIPSCVIISLVSIGFKFLLENYNLYLTVAFPVYS